MSSTAPPTWAPAIGDPYAAFLLGYPDYTDGQLHQQPHHGRPRLLLRLLWPGRLEGHAQSHPQSRPALRTASADARNPLQHRRFHARLDRRRHRWVTSVNGAVVVPNDQGLALRLPDFAAAIAPTPILTAAQAAFPSAFASPTTPISGPRLGFAWRPYGKDTTVLRGGWGRFIESPLGFSLVSGWAVASSYVATYNQDYQSDGVTPLLNFSNPFNTSAAARTARRVSTTRSPSTTRNPPFSSGTSPSSRTSATASACASLTRGSHGQNLEAMVDLNQVQPNTVGYAAASANLPLPAWSIIQSVANAAESNYNSRYCRSLAAQRQRTHLRRQLYLDARPLQCRRGHAQRLRRGRRHLSNRPLSSRARLRQRHLRSQASLSRHLALRSPFGKDQRWLSGSRCA